MKWYYTTAGDHVHVRVFFNGANCGKLCFRIEEFEQFRRDVNVSGAIEFVYFVYEGVAP